MKRFLLGLCAIILFVFWWYLVPSTNHWNQKLTMYIDTPQGEVVASSVINIKYGSALKWAGAMDGADFTVRGEATVADLGEGRFVFALLTGSPDGLQGLAREAYRDKYDAYRDQARNWDFTKWIKILTRQKEERVVPAHAYPMIVTFGDITDPTSVREVKAGAFTASFGEGYALKRMTLQVTDEAVTEGVERVLSWLNSLKGGYLHGGKTSKNAPLGLYGGNFKTGSFK